MGDWIYIDDYDQEPEIGGLISVDTRDFHCIPGECYEPIKNKLRNLPKNKKVEIEYKTFQEAKEWIKDLETKSGGKGKWRCIGDKWGRGSGWFKYVRILRTEKGYLIGCTPRIGGDDTWIYRSQYKVNKIQL